MIAQVDPPGCKPPPPSRRQERHHLHARLVQFARQPAQPGLRPRPIHQHAARNLPCHRARQGIGHAIAGAIVGEDVVQQVDVMRRRIDVADDAIDRAIVIIKQLDRVSGKDLKVPQILRQPHDMRELRGQIHRPFQVRARPLHLFLPDDLRNPRLQRLPSPRQVWPADQRIDDDPRPGEQEDEQQPPPRRRRRALARHVNEHDQADHPFTDVVDHAPAQHGQTVNAGREVVNGFASPRGFPGACGAPARWALAGVKFASSFSPQALPGRSGSGRGTHRPLGSARTFRA